MLNKTQLIDGIVELNQTARRDWLDLFDVSSLKRYFDHLRWTLGPRSGKNVWLRPDETPAMLTRTPID